MDSNTSSLTKIILIIEFVLVAYLIYSLTKNVYNSYLVDRYIAEYEKENSIIKTENQKKTSDYLYFTSEEYIDKIAKQNLGLVNPGEEVIVVSPDSLNYEAKNTGKDFQDILNGKKTDFEEEDSVKIETRSNPQKWWDFFFG